jgi:uncharacterized phage-associated protein
MATVFDVAKYILHKQGQISTWKLQKLCYYAQSWALAWTEKPLFNEDFEAWTNGPVCPPLFAEHKKMFMIGENDLTKGNISALTSDEKDTIDVVLNTYGDWQPYELREQTHNESPWKEARKGYSELTPSHVVIPKSSLGEYYGNL